MPRTKAKPVLRRRTLAEVAEQGIAESHGLHTSDLGFHSFCVEVFDTPESHAIFEQAELREPDQAVKETCGAPWTADADDEAKKRASQFIKKEIHDPELRVRVFYNDVLCKSEEDCKKDETFPQKSIGWLKARSCSITGSDFASAMCRNPYKSSKRFLSDKVGSSHGEASKFSQWGTDHEEHAEEAFKFVLDKRCDSPYRIDHPAIFKHVDAQWIAVSPDGILRHRDASGNDVVELVEYKAPAYYRHSHTYPYEKHKGGIPPQYYDQIQGTMWLMKNYDVCPGSKTVKGTYFVVWQPHALSVVYVPYCEEFATQLSTNLRKFYFEKFIPGCIDALKRSM
jgi:putative phage-type endonuclease